MKFRRFAPFALAALLATAPAIAEDGWKSLIDGQSTAGWTNAAGAAANAGWVVKDGALSADKGAGDIWTKDTYGDFVLEVEFKTTGNSGIFIRTGNPKDNVQTGIEIQVENPGGPDKHSVGALYDLVPPTKCNAKKDDWNKAKITAQGSKITVEINGEKVNEMDVDKWTTAGQNPDGSKNKYARAVKDFPRNGHIGFQDHGHAVSYRNVRIKPLSR